MAALLTRDELRAHVETDLADTPLDQLINTADQEIVQAVGGHNASGTVTELYVGGDRALFLDRQFESITSVTESRGSTDTVLVAADYRVWFGNRTLERLSLGATNPQANWGERVPVVYTPVDDDHARIGATIELVRLAIQHTGLKSERVGDYASASVDHNREKAAILARLNRQGWMP